MVSNIVHPEMKPFNIAQNGIAKLFRNLKWIQSSTFRQYISPRIPKELADEIAPIHQLMYQYVDTGKVVKALHTAKVRFTQLNLSRFTDFTEYLQCK